MNRACALLILLAAAVVTASAAGPESKDLSGVWNFSSDVPLERPTTFAGKKVFTREEFEQQRNAKMKALAMIRRFAPVEAIGVDWLEYTAATDDLRTSRISYPEDGRLPALVDGVTRLPSVDAILAAINDPKGAKALGNVFAALAGTTKNGHEDFGASERCLVAASVPLEPSLGGNHVQIVQSSGAVVLITDDTRRIVHVDGRPHLPATQRSWAGDSIGHWEGEVLVVQTKNFNSRTQSFAGAGTAEGKVVTERFSRPSGNVLQDEATIVDPKTFQDTVVVSFPMARADARVYESACHEGNYSLANMLSAARAEERAVATGKVDLLRAQN